MTKFNRMRMNNRIEFGVIASALLGFIYAIFSTGLNLGLAIADSAVDAGDTAKRISFSDNGIQLYEDTALRYFVISVMLITLIASTIACYRMALKAFGLIPLVIIILQTWSLISSKNDAIPAWTGKYSTLLGILWYLDFGYYSLLLVMTVAYIFLIRNAFRSVSETKRNNF